MILNHINLHSAGRTIGSFFFAGGIFYGIYGALVIFFGIGDLSPISLVYALLALTIIPVLFGVIGFVTGFIMATCYNIMASTFGGIEIEVEQLVNGRKLERARQ